MKKEIKTLVKNPWFIAIFVAIVPPTFNHFYNVLIDDIKEKAKKELILEFKESYQVRAKTIDLQERVFHNRDQ